MPILILLAIVVLYIWGEFKVFASTSAALGDFGPILVIITTVATAYAGTRLFARAGRTTMRRFAEAAAQGRPPVFEIADGGAITLAAGLLLLPGFITDGIGLVLFIPGLRQVLGIGLFALIFAAIPKRGLHFSADFRGAARPDRPEPFESGHESGENPHGGAEKKSAKNITIEGEFERKD